jgi:hypothetical protein
MRSYLGRKTYFLSSTLVVGLAFAGVSCVSESASVGPDAGSVVVTVVRSDGTPIDGAVVDIVGTSKGAVIGADGVAIITGPAGDQVIRVRYIGCTVASEAVTIPANGSVSVTVTLTCPPDAVQDAEFLDADRIWLLDVGSDASGPAECENDVLLQGTGTLELVGNATPTDDASASCNLAAFVLAADRGPFFSNTATDFPWTAAFGNLLSVTMPPKKLEVPLRIIISDASLNAGEIQDLTEDINSELALAEKIFTNSYSGITFVDPSGGAPQVVENDGATTLLSGGCANAASIKANPALYHEGRINVYYTTSVQNEEGVAGGGWYKAGYTCNTSDVPNMIFIDHDGHAVSLLAHELGHALGLITPAWGHGDEFEGFYRDGDDRALNAMVDPSLGDLPPDPGYFSVGQVSRMHLGNASWLNWPSDGAMTSLRTRQAMPGASVVVACGCPETAATSDCAATNTDIDRTSTGTKQGPATYKMACTVNATSAPAISLCVGKTAQTEARYYQGAEEGRSATTMWVAADPTKVRALSLGVTPNTNYLKGELTGLLVGTTTVRGYADGAFAAFTVTVTPPC